MSYKVTVWNKQTRRDETQEFATAEDRDAFVRQQRIEAAEWRRNAGMDYAPVNSRYAD